MRKAPRSCRSIRAVLTADDFATLTEAFARNGFQAPTNYYLNHEVHARYASAALNNGTLDIPVLFIGAAYDQVADIRSPRRSTRGASHALTSLK